MEFLPWNQSLVLFPEVIENAGVLYHPNTSDELCNALESLLADKDRYMQATKNARERASQFFNDKYMAQRLLTIYESIQ